MPIPAGSRVFIAPSLLAADFTRLGEEIRAAETAGADVLHIDIMDGHFVPNLTVGPPVVESLRQISSLPFDVHLMLTNPERFIEPFASAGADHITVHVEIGPQIDAVLASIHAAGCSAGISLRPATAVSNVLPFLDRVELVLVMTVEPGFGGQSFMADMLPRIRELRERIARGQRPVLLEADGGIQAGNARLLVTAGANLLVAGTSVFRVPGGPAAGIRQLRELG